jgi:hypothetical protein
LDLLKAFEHYQTVTGDRPGTKTLREAIFFHWEGPRLPPGRKYSVTIPHSRAAHERRATAGVVGLIYEHVVPVNVVIRRLLDVVPRDEAELERVLRCHADRVIITAEEDRALAAAGVGSVTADGPDIWSRYRAAGIDPTELKPFIIGQ